MQLVLQRSRMITVSGYVHAALMVDFRWTSDAKLVFGGAIVDLVTTVPSPIWV